MIGEDLRRRVIDPETGIIRWVSEIAIDPGEPAIFNYSTKMCDSGTFFPVACYDSNGGAGLSREAAYWAAVGESIERFCSSVFFPEEFVRGTRREVMAQGRALGPDEVALFHPNQRETIHYAWFTDETSLCWTPGYSLTAREPILLPACMVFVPYYPFYRERGELTIAPSISTGQACALSPAAAMLSGLFEIIERDAFMIAWLNRLPLPRIDIDSSDYVRQIFQEVLARPHLHYALFDMTTDIAVPAIVCVIVDDSQDPPLISVGGAANLDPERAALKALLEAAQTREWARFMGNQKEPIIIASDYSNIDDFEKHVFLYGYGDMRHALAFLLDNDRRRTFADFTNRDTGDVTRNLSSVVDRIEGQGYEIMMADLTTPDVRACGYCVVKMFVPQLQPMEGDHTHQFLGGRRLYEVPRLMGYAIDPQPESLNPYPHPYP